MLHFVGCHMLCGVSTRPHEHSQVTDTKLEQLCLCLESPELRIKSLAAVVLWQFAQTVVTLLRLPFHIAVPAMIDELVDEEMAIVRIEQSQSTQVGWAHLLVVGVRVRAWPRELTPATVAKP